MWHFICDRYFLFAHMLFEFRSFFFVICFNIFYTTKWGRRWIVYVNNEKLRCLLGRCAISFTCAGFWLWSEMKFDWYRMEISEYRVIDSIFSLNSWLLTRSISNGHPSKSYAWIMVNEWKKCGKILKLKEKEVVRVESRFCFKTSLKNWMN